MFRLYITMMYINRMKHKAKQSLYLFFISLYPSKHVLSTNLNIFMLNVLYVHAKYSSGV